MLRLIDLILARGSTPLIDRANITINPGRKVGIIGANGAGKSTLFAALRGQLHVRSVHLLSRRSACIKTSNSV